LNRTRILLVILVMVALIQIYPDRASLIEGVAIVGGGLYAVAWYAANARARYKRLAAESAQAAADDREYRSYREELDAIRARFDPDRALGEPTAMSADYQKELDVLHERHRNMLSRKFGPR
jgi:Tfp pilus assembly protein PilN